MISGIRRRIEGLEGLARQRRPRSSSAARGRMVEHLRAVAALRRGELGAEEAVELEETTAVVRRRLDELRGEGGKL